MISQALEAFEEAHRPHRRGRARRNPVSGGALAATALGVVALAAIGFAIYEKNAAAKTAAGSSSGLPKTQTNLFFGTDNGRPVTGLHLGDVVTVTCTTKVLNLTFTYTDATGGGVLKLRNGSPTPGSTPGTLVFTYDVVGVGTAPIVIHQGGAAALTFDTSVTAS